MRDLLAHEAMVYESDDRFVDVLAPFVATGLAAGEHACVVTRCDNADRLRDALGAQGDRVRFIDAVDWYRYPARTIAGYHRAIQAARAAGAPGIRVVGEVEFGTTDDEHAAWVRYESILNAVFARQPAWIICPYDARRLPDGIVESARRTHGHETVGPEQRQHSEAYVDPRHFVAALPLELHGEVLVEQELGSDLHALRRLAAQVAYDVGLGEDRALDLVLLLGELVTNALVHGAPPVHLRACRDDAALTVEVRDGGGTPLDPLAGFSPPSQEAVGGAGLWICRQIAERLEITSGRQGTTVRARLALSPPGFSS